ncbi:Omp28-related outer membrane protein [Capnocytophaga stomatis]|uniref:Omp28-related outer membrane protein n=1 Tax=Capnocytophaga stomatis TaxID=1848904 RepID=UPI001BB3AD11|nr:Omp28-related outer membrane protein [Capnocytophaga stomatis]
MRKNFLFSLAILMVSFFVVSCSKEDDSSKETGKRSEIVKEENSKEEEIPNQENSNSSDNNSNQDNNNNNSAEGNTQEGSSTEKKNIFAYKAYVEDVTATWCHNCPRTLHAIERAKKVEVINKKFVSVAVHYRDHMQVGNVSEVLSPLRTLHDSIRFESAVPWFRMNRNRYLYASNAHEHLDKYLQKKSTSPVGIKISSNLTQNGGKISVGFKFGESMNNLKYSVFIVEDKIIHSQTGGSYNFEHNDVLRAVYGNGAGNDLGSVNKDEEITKNDLQVNYSLLSAGKLSNVKVVVFISDAATGEVLNVQEAKANETKDYQYAE